ncbi:MAG: hypothetical protein JW747_08240 [Candidatus Aminicenantes bacterium]|nr:hypothetical protein [Candidatus Aminicenantes bacterium]
MIRAAPLLLCFAAVLPAWTGEFMDDPKEALASLLPDEIEGWRSAASDRLFDPETIFDYIDGAGEVYRSYNFRILLSRRYECQDRAALVADLFDMGSSRDAFGVFTHDLEGEDAGLGQGSNYKGGLLSFWRDRYFVSLYAEEETEETKRTLFALGAAVAEAVGRDGAEPGLLRLLPERFRRPGSVRYFHTHHVLNYHFFVAAENILNLGPKTEAVLAGQAAPVEAAPDSMQDPGGGVLLVVRYPTAAEASEAFSGFLNAYMPGAGPRRAPLEGARLVRTEDGRWTGIFARGDVVAIVFQEAEAVDVLDALDHIAGALEKGR